MAGSSPFAVSRQRTGLAAAFIIIGIVGRLLLAEIPNVETVLAVSLLAGFFLGGVYMLVVPLTIMVVSDVIIYGVFVGGVYPPEAILGLTAFTWSGFVFVALIGRMTRPRVLKVIRNVALVTAVSIPATIAYDLWTTLGGWYFIYQPLLGWTLWEALLNLLPFLILHLISSLIFVPLLGTLVGLIHEHGWSLTAPREVPGEARDWTTSAPWPFGGGAWRNPGAQWMRRPAGGHSGQGDG